MSNVKTAPVAPAASTGKMFILKIFMGLLVVVAIIVGVLYSMGYIGKNTSPPTSVGSMFSSTLSKITPSAQPASTQPASTQPAPEKPIVYRVINPIEQPTHKLPMPSKTPGYEIIRIRSAPAHNVGINKLRVEPVTEGSTVPEECTSICNENPKCKYIGYRTGKIYCYFGGDPPGDSGFHFRDYHGSGALYRKIT